MKEGDTVTLLADFPQHRLPAGAAGTVVSVHADGPTVMFAVMHGAPLVVKVPSTLLR